MGKCDDLFSTQILTLRLKSLFPEHQELTHHQL